MVLHSAGRRSTTKALSVAIGVLTASAVVSGPASASRTVASHVSTTARAKAFCTGARSLAALDTKTLKDVASSVNVLSPGYVSKQFGGTLAALHVMYLHSPTAVLPTTREYLNAYIAYGRQIGDVHWKLQPTDPGEQKIVLNATAAYAPVATADLPKLDSFVKKTCGFGLNLVSAPK